MRPERFHPAALLAAVRGRLRAVFARRAVERELDEEVRFHLDMEVDKNVRAGMSPAEARRVAVLAFGGVDRITEAHRDARGTRFLDDALADLRHAARSLARTPGFVVTSVFTLAVAIAIGTILFTAVNGFFYRPLPVPGGAALVVIFTSDYSSRERRGASSYPDVVDFAATLVPAAEVAGAARVMLGIGTHENIVMVPGALVSPGYFRMLRVIPALGRFPETSPSESPGIVLSHALWRRTFGSDSSLLGRAINVNGQPFIVVAVAPPEFRGTSREIADDFWIDVNFAPLVLPGDDLEGNRGARRFHTLARLRGGTSLAVLNARLDVLASGLARAYPDTWRDTTGNGRVVVAMLERDAHMASAPRGAIRLVIGGVVAIGLGLLVVASTNLASLQMARGAARRREIATRIALGAGRGRLIRQLLAECALITAPGAIAGVMVSFVVSTLVLHYLPIPLPSIDLSLDWRVLCFIAAGLLLTVLVFGLMPALQTVRSDVLTDLKGGRQPGAAGVHVGGLRGGLIITQVALSVLFTTTSALVAFALIRDAGEGRGDARKVLIARVNFLPAAGDSGRVQTLTDELIDGIRAIPGVENASGAEFIPVRGTRRTVDVEIRDVSGQAQRLALDANAVRPSYFAVLGLAVLRGRDFEPGDARDTPRVVIVSRAMADALWPSEDPIGRRITLHTRRGSAAAEVIGVVSDPPGHGPATAESRPGLLYLPMRDRAEGEVVLHFRAPGAQSAIAGHVMQRLRAERANLAVSEAITLDQYYDRILLPQRLMGQAAGGLAAFQLLLAVAGLSGLVAYVTALRRRDVGIRAALGASRRDVLALVMRQGMRLTAIGGSIGIALGIAISRVVAASLPVTTPMVLGAVLVATVIFVVTGAIAMVLPAQRALSISPSAALRVD